MCQSAVSFSGNDNGTRWNRKSQTVKVYRWEKKGPLNRILIEGGAAREDTRENHTKSENCFSSTIRNVAVFFLFSCCIAMITGELHRERRKISFLPEHTKFRFSLLASVSSKVLTDKYRHGSESHLIFAIRRTQQYNFFLHRRPETKEKREVNRMWIAREGRAHYTKRVLGHMELLC